MWELCSSSSLWSGGRWCGIVWYPQQIVPTLPLGAAVCLQRKKTKKFFLASTKFTFSRFPLIDIPSKGLKSWSYLASPPPSVPSGISPLGTFSWIWRNFQLFMHLPLHFECTLFFLQTFTLISPGLRSSCWCLSLIVASSSWRTHLFVDLESDQSFILNSLRCNIIFCQLLSMHKSF